MAYKKIKEPTLTANDLVRIANIDSNPHTINRKCRVGMTLRHKNIAADIYIIVYGKDKAQIKENIQYNIDFFTKNDKLWKLVKLDDLKKNNKDD